MALSASRCARRLAVANRPLSPPILIALLTIAAFALCRGSTGSAQPSHLTLGGVLPYVGDGFEHGVGPPWDQTPNDDSRLFRLVQGYRSRKALALTVTPTSYGPNLSGQMTAVSLQHEIAHAGWSAEPTGGTWYRAYVRFPRRRGATNRLRANGIGSSSGTTTAGPRHSHTPTRSQWACSPITSGHPKS